LEIELNLPNNIEPFCVVGEVVYRHNIRGRPSHIAGEMGIKFVSLEKTFEMMLNELTKQYGEIEAKHTVMSKEMSTFQDPTIIDVQTGAGQKLSKD